jgi:hypothetical protein
MIITVGRGQSTSDYCAAHCGCRCGTDLIVHIFLLDLSV